MPFINIGIAGVDLNDGQKQKIFSEVTRLMHEVMGKIPELTSVRIDHFYNGDWAINGMPISSGGDIAVHMDIKVTEGTNSRDEKASMIKQSSDMLKDVMGPVAEVSYIVIHDLSGDSWGYDGQTQFERAQQRLG